MLRDEAGQALGLSPNSWLKTRVACNVGHIHGNPVPGKQQRKKSQPCSFQVALLCP